ncbi:MAG: hypothetical protein R3B45_09060 [Bdellovibrionota bacterium]
MKARILIIEDSYCQFFTAKQVLQSQLRLQVKAVKVADIQELAQKTIAFEPSFIIDRPCGGVVPLMEQMKKRQANRRNTEILLILAEEIEELEGPQIKNFIDHFNVKPVRWHEFADVA